MTAIKEESFTLLFDDQNIKWEWTPKELQRFRKMWDGGKTVSEMANAFHTSQRSIALLVMDQEYKERIKPRRFGLWGH